MNMKICLDRRVLAGLAAVGLAVAVLAPNLIGAALPLLLLAACPLSMLVMMLAMGKMGGGRSSGAAERIDRADGGEPTDARLADLKGRLAGLQGQQDALARTIAELEAADARPAGGPEAVAGLADGRGRPARGTTYRKTV